LEETKKISHGRKQQQQQHDNSRTNQTEPNKSERPAAAQEKKKNGEGQIQVRPAAEETEQRPDNTKIGWRNTAKGTIFQLKSNVITTDPWKSPPSLIWLKIKNSVLGSLLH
jgi:hypothetical protein